MECKSLIYTPFLVYILLYVLLYSHSYFIMYLNKNGDDDVRYDTYL